MTDTAGFIVPCLLILIALLALVAWRVTRPTPSDAGRVLSERAHGPARMTKEARTRQLKREMGLK
jgi:hypothetical protein